jgi:hypothetical protein
MRLTTVASASSAWPRRAIVRAIAPLMRFRKGGGFGGRSAHAAGSSQVAKHADARSPAATNTASWRRPGRDENARTGTPPPSSPR